MEERRFSLPSHLRDIPESFSQPTSMKKDNLDREALLLFKVLYETRNLLKAAEQIGLPAATASRTLARLRDTFGDELFTRCAGGLTPTFAAHDLIDRVDLLLAGFDSLFSPKVFDPRKIERTFHIACADHGVFFVQPAVTQVTAMSPGIEVDLHEIDNNWASRLQSGEFDFVISPVSSVPEGCEDMPLVEIASVLAVNENHPLVKRLAEKGTLTPEDYLQYRFIEIAYKPTWLYKQFTSQRTGIWSEQRIAVRTPYFFSAFTMLRNTDLLLRLSKTLANEVVQMGGITLLPVPDDFAPNFTPRLVWHERSRRDPAMQWFRSLIISGAAAYAENPAENDGAPALK